MRRLLLVLAMQVVSLASAQEAPLTCAGDQTWARIARTVDGDTVFVDPMILYGWSMPSGQVRVEFVGRVRLKGVDAPELPSPGGKAAMEHLRSLLPDGSQTCLRIVNKWDAYARPLVIINLATGTANERMIADGFAKVDTKRY